MYYQGMPPLRERNQLETPEPETLELEFPEDDNEEDNDNI